MIKNTLLLLTFFAGLSLKAQDVERARPAEWDNLVPGGQFVDRLLPMPIMGQLTSNTWGARDVVPRDTLNGIEDPAWSYWGGRFFKSSDGKFNSFIARWPETHPMGHWAYHYSEVVHVQSDNPVGPYVPVGEPIGLGHNPELYQLKDGRWLLYIVGAGHAIKYLVADQLDGPWKEGLWNFDLRDRKKLRFMVNMTFVQREDGSYLAIPRAGDVWISPSGIDTFYRVGNQTSYPPIPGKFEDPLMWKDHIQYHMIVNDWYGRIAHYQRSKDGVHWKAEPGTAYYPGVSRYEDGTRTTWYKYERPHVLQDEYGRATQINFAVIDSSKHADFPYDNHNSKNISIPLVPERLLEITNKKAINSNTKKINVLIKAEEGFDPQQDIDLSSMRFGASEVVNFGKGSKILSTQKKGKDLLLTFEGKGNGLSDKNFAAKLLGKTTSGTLLLGYARLPEVAYLEPILSSRKAFINEENRLQIEVQNFGVVASTKTQLIIAFSTKDKQYTFTSGLPALKPYEKVNLNIENNTQLKGSDKGQMRVYIEGKKDDPIYAQKQAVDLLFGGNQVFQEQGKKLTHKDLLIPGKISYRATKGGRTVKYYVYVPTQFNPRTPPPIVIAFSPNGQGMGILNKMKDAAEANGWIVVGCDSLKNGMKDEVLEMEIEDVLMNDILKMVHYNKNRVYLAGFSGGAMRAYGIAARRPEKFAGLIAFGGWLGGDDYQNAPYPKMAVALINGDKDDRANKWVEKDTKALEHRACTVKYFTFDGGHKIAPASVTSEAMQWLQKQ